MEFRRPKWDETRDDGLVRGHEWRIFPILHRRYLFADVEQFLLYDFYRPSGGVDEEVFAYSNRFNDERGLVIYHNKFADTKGWIKTSAAYIDKSSGKTKRRNLAEGLGLPRVGHVIFKDYVTHLEYIRSCKEIWDKGLYVELGAYQSHAFMDFRFVGDIEWKTICDQLNGAGVQSMQDEWKKLFAVAEEVVVEEKPAKKKRAVRKAAVKKKPVAKKAAVKSKAKTKKAPVKAKAAKVAAKKEAPKAKKAVVKKVAAPKAKPAKKVVVKTKPVATKKVIKPIVAKKKAVVNKPAPKPAPAKKAVKKKK
ncbi:MAG: hypothetical protein IPO22_16425 [Anaerolineales bacterium]|nr:hypothetical protein [Anaerolineales bacterium]